MNSRLLSWAVEEAYHSLLMTGKHPVAVLNVSIPAPEVDVNIHPAKTELKFRNEHRVFSAVQRAVRRVLLEPSAVPKIEDSTATYAAPPPLRQTLPVQLENEMHPVARPAQVASHPIPAFSLPALRLLGQVAGCYIVAEGPDGLYLIDQHAAHERIIFERINAQRSEKQVEVQGLLEPATFELSPAQDAVLRSHIEELASSGFLLEPFGDRTYMVRTVPTCLDRKDWLSVLHELTDAGSGSDWTERLAMSIACHSAIRAGRALGDDEMRELLRQLERTALPNNCPHGRPTMIHLTSAQLEKEFGRRG